MGTPKFGWDLSPDAIREAQRTEVYLRTIMDLLDKGTEKPPWATVEGADLEVQQLYAQWEALQLQDGILYMNFKELTAKCAGGSCWFRVL